MNGIKEDIKSIGVLDPCTPASQEAMASIASRLKVLQVLICTTLSSLVLYHESATNTNGQLM